MVRCRGLVLGAVLVGCTADAESSERPWDEDRIGVGFYSPDFGTVELPSGSVMLHAEVPPYDTLGAWWWTMGGRAVALDSDDGVVEFDVDGTSSRPISVNPSHPPRLVEVTPSGRFAVVLESGSGESFLVTYTVGSESSWVRLSSFGPVAGVRHTAVAETTDNVILTHPIDPQHLELVELAPEGVSVLGVLEAGHLFSVALSASGRVAVALGEETWIDGVSVPVDSRLLQWRGDELTAIDYGKRRLLRMEEDGSVLIEHVFDGDAVWFSWSACFQHWMAIVSCEERQSRRLVVDGRDISGCVDLKSAEWSRRQPLFAYLWDDGSSDPSRLSISDLDGKRLELDGVARSHFAP